MSHIVVYGGQYGSEGKASAAEYWAKRLCCPNQTLYAIGENGPNCGHTCSKGRTRILPAVSFFADVVVLGPDSVIDIPQLHKEVSLLDSGVQVRIHENAAVLFDKDHVEETREGLRSRIFSTASGTGAARNRKFFLREENAIIKEFKNLVQTDRINVMCQDEYLDFVTRVLPNGHAIFECAQGVMLDPNFGVYPYVTSRSTLPQVAIARNGLSSLPWLYCGVYRTFPIRVGGPSGPTGGEEITWASLKRKPERTSVTHTIRRVFKFNAGDFYRSVTLSCPDYIMFTFADYLKCSFTEWFEEQRLKRFFNKIVMYSKKPAQFQLL